GDLQPAAPTLHRRPGVPRAARVERGVLRRADDGYGYGDQERRGNDRVADALYEQGPAGGDHPRNHRSRFRRRGVINTMATATATAQSVGKIVQIIGPVLDVEFAAGQLPEIYNALEITTDAKEIIVAEVEQHLGENRVRAVAMKPTDGLRRG